MVAWNRLIRFVATDGKIYYGEPLVPEGEDVGKAARKGKALEAKKLAGDIFSSEATLTNEVVGVQKLLGPLDRSQVPLIRCVGLNYMKHIREAKRTPPPYPSMFFKPGTSVADYGEPIPAPKITQDGQLDYEGELCVVIGKACKDVSKENALDYVLGYTAGNDVSARSWQRDPKRAGGVPQWCFSKGFDKWAPLGPVLVSPAAIGDPGNLELETYVNGERRQHTNTDDLIFSVAEIIAFSSQGTTLEPGTVIMTGTPGGVGIAKDTVPRPLNNGDEVSVTIEKIGTLYNNMMYI